jgi:predicted Zn-dependent protease
MFGVQILLDVLAGDAVALKEITGALVGLKFSRKHETQADEKSVEYLCPTDYNAAGGAGFFEKIEQMGGSSVPEFLSTHPDPGNRVEHFHNTAITSGCQGKNEYKSEYEKMVSKLPK